MEAEKIKNLVRELCNKEITYKNYNDESSKTTLVWRNNETIVEQIIREHLLDNRDEEVIILQSKIGLLKAKVKFYEEMISKSTFAPMISKEENITNEIIDTPNGNK